MSGYQTGAGNRMTNDGVYAYTYDDEGNVTKKSKGANDETWTFGYDHNNHMVWAEKRATDGGTLQMRADYKYDVFGNRIEKVVDPDGAGGQGSLTTRFGYDGWDVWVDMDGSNALVQRYVHGDAVDQLFARVKSDGTRAWYLQDRQGSVAGLVDSSGTPIATLAYDGFGELTSAEDADSDRYRYTGREWDAETGLQYNRARYYDPKTGRFYGSDPIFADANRYRYGLNQPTGYGDANGLAPQRKPANYRPSLPPKNPPGLFQFPHPQPGGGPFGVGTPPAPNVCVR
jgi:RHS repeat-associated protein